jgi:hypothetical protein
VLTTETLNDVFVRKLVSHTGVTKKLDPRNREL